MTYGETLIVCTKGFSDILNITCSVENAVKKSGIRDGIVAVTAMGSTASVTTMEFEPALKEDMRELLNNLAPETMKSRHSETWGDDNGFSHLRASLMGPGITMPVEKGKLLAGTWQQVVVIDHDNRPRERSIRIQVVGD